MRLGPSFVGVQAMLAFFVLAMAPACYSDPAFDAKVHGLSHYIMAVCDELNGQAPEALLEYQKSVKYNGSEPASRLKLGAHYLKANKIGLAIKQLKAVTRLAPEEAQAHYLLALAYSSQHKYEAAASEYESILKLASHDQPSNTEIYIYLGDLYYAEGKYAPAIEAFLKVVRADPTDSSALFLLGSVYADNNDNTDAVAAFRKVLAIDPNNSEALNSLGYIYAEQGVHLNDAIGMIRRAIAIDPVNGAYYDSLGWGLFKQGNLNESLAVLQKAESFTTDEILYDHIGEVYKALKQYPLAIKYWRKSLDRNPHQTLVQRKIKDLEKCLASESHHRLN